MNNDDNGREHGSGEPLADLMSYETSMVAAEDHSQHLQATFSATITVFILRHIP